MHLTSILLNLLYRWDDLCEVLQKLQRAGQIAIGLSSVDIIHNFDIKQELLSLIKVEKGDTNLGRNLWLVLGTTLSL